ncbi:hypothetical protein AB0A63_00300 [Lentzea sp. NPDC042327]|uniref:hypothetical protein n=1 Tax=Lentzea sp. NPDC042327 TaxID=3154801 RepID=UPI003411BDDE
MPRENAPDTTDLVRPPKLYLKLVELAFTQLAKARPTVLTLDGSSPVSRIDFSPWTTKLLPTINELAPAADDLLQTGPSLLLPPWERIEGRLSAWRDEYEKVLSSLEPTKPGAVLGALIPANGLQSTSSVAFRRALDMHWQTVLVMYTRDLVPGIHRNVGIATIFLRARDADAQPPLRLFRYSPGDEESAVIDDFGRLLKRSGGRGEFGYVLRDVPPVEAGLGFARHDPAIKAREAALTDFAGAASFGDVFEHVFQGRVDRRLFCSRDEPDVVRVISGRDLKRDGTIAPPDEWTRWARLPTVEELCPGDVLLQAISGRDKRSLAVVQVTEADLPITASQTVVVLRPGQDVPATQLSLVIQYLRSPLAREIVARFASSLGGDIRIHASALRELPLPHLDEALSAALEDIARAVNSFEAWHAEAEAALHSAFPADEDFKAGRMRLVDLGRRSRLRVEAAANLDDHGYIVRTRFPYPIAYRWRTVEAAKSAGVSGDAYETVLKTAEVLLCYAAHLALVFAKDAGIELGYSSQVRAAFGRGKGLGFGDWAAILEEVRDGKAFRTLPDAHPLRDLQSMLSNQAARDARRRLNDRRNDESHLRNVDVIDLPVAFESAFVDLMTLLEVSDFLSDLTLIHVTEVRWDNIHRRTEVAYRELMGDHPVAPTRTLSYTDPGIEVGSLYLIDGNHRLHLLRPYLIGRICMRCRNWSTFHCDGIKGDHVTLKSLEHGHTTDDHTLAETLRRVGLV